ncbi:TPA: hypothetical protein N0F65_009664 [Lagenidium giganteum]|uniref:Uncharacterized protein n=1 Tax=Lagenidium giganteum TaxID=4803 RepID=A0AAV2YW76_9STRA|nr:TPA: hypothetical protein N0F65_009664 [Lagenidium giganteum]
MKAKTKTKSRRNRYPLVSDSDSKVSRAASDYEFKQISLLENEKNVLQAPLRVKVQLCDGEQTFDALLISGASKSIVSTKILNQRSRSVTTSATIFETMSKRVESMGATQMQFRFQRLNPAVKITRRLKGI